MFWPWPIIRNTSYIMTQNTHLILRFFFFSCPWSALLLGGLSLVVHIWPLCCDGPTSHCSDFTCCDKEALGHAGFSSCGAWAQRLRSGSRTRDRTRVPCTGRRIPNHWTSREILILILTTSDPLGLSNAMLSLVLSPHVLFHFIPNFDHDLPNWFHSPLVYQDLRFSKHYCCLLKL